MESISLGKLETGASSSFRDIRHIVSTDLWPKIYSEAVSCVHDEFKEDSPEKTAALNSLKALRARSKKDARMFSRNQTSAEILQNRVASRKDGLVVKAINRIYPRRVCLWDPWSSRSGKRGLMKPNGLSALAFVYQNLIPLVRDVKESARGSFFESIPYICYVVVIVALTKYPAAQTVGWWQEQENCIELVCWAHDAAKQKDDCPKIWSGIDLLFEAQNVTYGFFAKDIIMAAVTDEVNRVTHEIERHNNSSEDDPWHVAYYSCFEMDKVDKLVELVNDIDTASGEQMRIRYSETCDTCANVNSLNGSAPFSDAFLRMRREAAKLWTTIVAAVEKAKADERLLSALKQQRQARHIFSEDSKRMSVQGLADHLAEGLRFGLLLHNGAALIREQIIVSDEVNIFMDRIDSHGQLVLSSGPEASESECELG